MPVAWWLADPKPGEREVAAGLLAHAARTGALRPGLTLSEHPQIGCAHRQDSAPALQAAIFLGSSASQPRPPFQGASGVARDRFTTLDPLAAHQGFVPIRMKGEDKQAGEHRRREPTGEPQGQEEKKKGTASYPASDLHLVPSIGSGCKLGRMSEPARDLPVNSPAVEEAVELARHGVITHLTIHGERVAAIVPESVLDALRAAEDAEDAAEAEAAMNEPGDSIPLEELEAEFGL
jgi:hypothetical protein